MFYTCAFCHMGVPSDSTQPKNYPNYLAQGHANMAALF